MVLELAHCNGNRGFMLYWFVTLLSVCSDVYCFEENCEQSCQFQIVNFEFIVALTTYQPVEIYYWTTAISSLLPWYPWICKWLYYWVFYWIAYAFLRRLLQYIIQSILGTTTTFRSQLLYYLSDIQPRVRIDFQILLCYMEVINTPVHKLGI